LKSSGATIGPVAARRQISRRLTLSCSFSSGISHPRNVEVTQPLT